MACGIIYLVSGSQDSTIKQWDIKTRKLMIDLLFKFMPWIGISVVSGGKDRQV